MRLPLFLITIFIFSSCHRDDIKDKSKRNANWAWWVDASTGKGEWIPIGEYRTVKNGSYTHFYFNGNIHERGKYLNGKNVDTIFFYNINGQLDSYQFINPKDTSKYVINVGHDTVYYYFLNDGLHKIFDENGVLMDQGVSKSHLKYGPWIIYYFRGDKRFVRNFIEDSSWQVEYYENGNRKDSGYDYLHRGIYAVCKSWYENGQVSAVKQWRDGIQDGLTIEYTEKDDKPQSALYRVSTWKDGVLDGTELIYYETGQVKDSFGFVNGEKDGLLKRWYDNGKLKSMIIYNNGNLVSDKEYDENGNVLK